MSRWYCWNTGNTTLQMCSCCFDEPGPIEDVGARARTLVERANAAPGEQPSWRPADGPAVPEPSVLWLPVGDEEAE
jgi:hypothetical protein